MGECRNRAGEGRSTVTLPVSAKPTPNPFKRTTPPLRPNPALDDYTMQASKNRRGPARRPVCALSNLVLLGGAQVCFGDGAIHNEHCPENRRQMRRRDFWTRVYQVTLLVWTLGLLGVMLIGFWMAR